MRPALAEVGATVVFAASSSCFYVLSSTISSCSVSTNPTTRPSVSYVRIYDVSEHGTVIHVMGLLHFGCYEDSWSFGP